LWNCARISILKIGSVKSLACIFLDKFTNFSLTKNVWSSAMCFSLLVYLSILFIQRSLKRFICRNLASTVYARLIVNQLSITRRPGLDRKNVTERFTEFRDRTENGKLIILSQKRDRTRTDCLLFRATLSNLPRLWPFPSVVSLGAFNPRPFSVQPFVFRTCMLCNIKSRFEVDSCFPEKRFRT